MKLKDNPGCSGCPLAKLYPDNNFVPPTIGTRERLLIGEAAGETEAALGRPFCGGSGNVLDMWLRKAGIKREELTILNVLQCRPPENTFPTDSDARSYISAQDGYKAVHQCIRNYVLPVLLSRNWKRIDIIGSKALEFIANKIGIHKWRGSPIEIDTDEIAQRVAK